MTKTMECVRVLCCVCVHDTTGRALPIYLYQVVIGHDRRKSNSGIVVGPTDAFCNGHNRGHPYNHGQFVVVVVVAVVRESVVIVVAAAVVAVQKNDEFEGVVAHNGRNKAGQRPTQCLAIGIGIAATVSKRKGRIASQWKIVSHQGGDPVPESQAGHDHDTQLGPEQSQTDGHHDEHEQQRPVQQLGRRSGAGHGQHVHIGGVFKDRPLDEELHRINHGHQNVQAPGPVLLREHRPKDDQAPGRNVDDLAGDSRGQPLAVYQRLAGTHHGLDVEDRQDRCQNVLVDRIVEYPHV
mmetsp:Transcript_15931/g.34564  ORF Transcript_15931/g.34564 Transcript_15931/m.34564 type:complete len:294 (-) Transcript_15931:57-938(-)